MIHDHKARLRDPVTRAAALNEIGRAMLDMCLSLGADASLAWSLAATLVAGIERSYDAGAETLPEPPKCK